MTAPLQRRERALYRKIKCNRRAPSVCVCVGAPKPRAGLPRNHLQTSSHLYSQTKISTAARGGCVGESVRGQGVETDTLLRWIKQQAVWLAGNGFTWQSLLPSRVHTGKCWPLLEYRRKIKMSHQIQKSYQWSIRAESCRFFLFVCSLK